jgi:hypothetical protein
MKQVVTVALVIAILYILKVDGVVSFVNGALVPVQTVINYVIDVGTHVRERHPFFYIFLWFFLLFLMRPEYESYSFRKDR